MAKILIAEDSSAQAIAIKAMLEKAEHTVRVARDGDEAIWSIETQSPDILLTDMHMPGKNGLEVTQEVRSSFPDIPVVLMTADGTEDLAVEALAKGASNYIPKKRLNEDLNKTINDIAEMLTARKKRNSVFRALTHSEATYTIGNDREFASTLISHFENELQRIGFDDETGTFRIVTALKEAVLNAIDHGNLELDSKLRDSANGSEFYKLANQRLTEEPYCYRNVTVTVRLSPEQLAYIIRDEGPGFDPSTLPDPSDPENLLKPHGRGLLLIRSFMDDIVFSERGNQVTLIKYRVDPNLDTLDEPPMLARRNELKILLAEDSMTNQVLATSLLEREGHSVSVACNGQEAVSMAAEEQFDLILMDLEMPVMDGLTATEKIRHQEEESAKATVPIIAMTVHNEDHDIQRCLDAGMQAHIAKPVQAEILCATLDRL